MVAVHVEFRRVQTYLFAVPRLRAMVGANALLAKVLRKDLKELAVEYGATPPPEAVFPQVDVGHDPLLAIDDPARDLKAGILSRDGGHFEAFFPDEERARGFAEQASRVIRRALPGLLFDVHVGEQEMPGARAGIPVELPHFQVCQLTGRGPASARVRTAEEGEWASLDAIGRMEPGLIEYEDVGSTGDATGGVRGGDRSDSHDYDIVGLLDQRLARPGTRAPSDLTELCGTEYLAVIHADGNGIGSRVPHAHRGELSKRLEAQAFFRTCRAANRAALSKAIEETFRESSPVRPYQILMLGGDDLLLVCRASYALPFLVRYAKELQNYRLYDGRPLTIGAGVAIARPTVPFYRLHQIAEGLASSAKRLCRGLDGTEAVSVVDWAVFSNSWLEDPIEVRVRESVITVGGWRLVLTGRPLRILGEGMDSLEGLVNRANKLDEAVRHKLAARSQLRAIVDRMAKGRLAAEVAFINMAPDTLKVLNNLGIQEPWQESNPRERWTLSRLPDLIEVFEIGRLGRSKRRSSQQAADPGEEAVR